MTRQLKPGRPKRTSGPTRQVGIDHDLAVKARYVAAAQSLAVADYLSARIRPLIESDFSRVSRKIPAAGESNGKGRTD